MISEGRVEVARGAEEVTEGPVEIAGGPVELSRGPEEVTGGPVELSVACGPAFALVGISILLPVVWGPRK